MTTASLEEHLSEYYSAFATFYKRFLDTPDGQNAPQREAIESIRDLVQEVADGEPCTPLHQLALTVATRHYHDGIQSVELGYPEPSLNETSAADTILRSAGDLLTPDVKKHGEVAKRVVAKLWNGVSPHGQQEVAALLALLTRPIRLHPSRAKRASPVLN